MNIIEINQFTNTDSLFLSNSIYEFDRKKTPLVTITQRSGSMSFQFDMTVEQARNLAMALMSHAAAVEQKAISEQNHSEEKAS